MATQGGTADVALTGGVTRILVQVQTPGGATQSYVIETTAADGRSSLAAYEICACGSAWECTEACGVAQRSNESV